MRPRCERQSHGGRKSRSLRDNPLENLAPGRRFVSSLVKFAPAMKSVRLAFFLLCACLAPLASGQTPSGATERGPKVNYTYNAVIVRVVEADMVSVDVDLGFGVWFRNQTFKLADVKAPDPAQDKDKALQWKTKTQEILPVGLEVVMKSVKDKTNKVHPYQIMLWKDGEDLNDQIAKGP